jgi:uncharacterized protein (TIGR00297 family)
MRRYGLFPESNLTLSFPMIAKTIPPARDRIQSRLLVSVVTPWLVVVSLWKFFIQHDRVGYALPSHYFALAISISLAFALVTWLLKAATPGAATGGGLICLLLATVSVVSPPSLLHSALPPLALLFILTFAATRFGRAKKEARGLSEPRTGRRASQVIANLGIAALFAAYSRTHSIHLSTLAYCAALAALAEATADTLSSEIGQAIAGPAFLISNFRRVPPGTDGAISLAGTLAGLIGAAAVTFAGLPPQSFKLLVFLPVFTAATAGLFFDSLVGATLERRGYVGNDLVNFASTAFAAAIFYPLAYVTMSLLHI